jgi:non-specific serine/threonine protein kinase/serine/threonine-protein kinase
MTSRERAESLFESWLEAQIRDGEAPDPASLCGGEPEVLSRLESLIASYRVLDEALPSPSHPDAARSILDSMMAHIAADPQDPQDPASRLLRRSVQPPVVENYRVVSLLGAGGMGEVWEAEQLAPVTRRVALKVIKRGADTAHVVRRFAAERQALAAMDHSAIAKVFEAGATTEGRPYFAMELVQGEPIDQFADRRRLTIRQRLELFASVCDGVQHAHQKGLIHRDLKPSNILVSSREEGTAPDGERRFEPKLIDFGIAKAIMPQTVEPWTLTVVGQVVGTPSYMSPEQADSTSQDIDTRSDVYALGIVLYQLLVDSLPFGTGPLIKEVRPVDPSPPSERLAAMVGSEKDEVADLRGCDPGYLVRKLRGDVDWVVMKALAYDRDSRYASVAALADDVRRSLRDEPVSAGPPSVAYRLRKMARRHRAAVAVASTVLLAVIASLAGLGFGLTRALEAEAQAKAESETARRVSDLLVDAFRAGDPSYGGGSVAARDIVDNAVTRIGNDLAGEPAIRARLTQVLAEASMNLGEFEQAAALATDAVQLASSVLGEDAEETVAARRLEARIMTSAGRLDEAETRLRTLLAAEASRRPGGLLEAKIANDLGILLQSKEQHEESERHLRRALDIYRTEGIDKTDRDAIRSLHNLAFARRHQGDTREAAGMLTEVLELQHRILTPPNTDIATTLNDLASATRELGDLEKAESLYRQALEQRQAILSPNHPDVAQSLNNVGSARYWAEDYEQAAVYMKRAFDVWQVSYGGDHPRLCAALANLGAVSGRGGHFDQAEDYYQQALEMETRLHGADHVRVAAALRRLGDLRLQAGRPAAAVDALVRSVETYSRSRGTNDPQSVTAALSLATAYRAADQSARAETLLHDLADKVMDDEVQSARVREALGAS